MRAACFYTPDSRGGWQEGVASVGIVHWPRFNDHIEPERVPSAVGRLCGAGWGGGWPGTRNMRAVGTGLPFLGWPGDAKQVDTAGDTGHDWEGPKSFVGLFLADVVG